MVGRPTARAASAKRTTPYMPSWSVMASASSPSRTASSTSSSGCDAPSRKLKLEWQCSSAYGTLPRRRCRSGSSGNGGGWYGWRLRELGRSDSRRSSSHHGIDGLLNPLAQAELVAERHRHGAFLQQVRREASVIGRLDGPAAAVDAE